MKCSLRCAIDCQSAISGTFKNISLLKARDPGVLPIVVAIVHRIACIAVDNAASIMSLLESHFLEDYCRAMYVGYCLLSGAFFRISNWIADFYSLIVHL